jgi:hypothetical protein
MESASLGLAGVLVALRTPELHHAGGVQGVGSRGESAGRAATRRAFQLSHDAALHRGRYRSQREQKSGAYTDRIPYASCVVGGVLGAGRTATWVIPYACHVLDP